MFNTTFNDILAISCRLRNVFSDMFLSQALVSGNLFYLDTIYTTRYVTVHL